MSYVYFNVYIYFIYTYTLYIHEFTLILIIIIQHHGVYSNPPQPPVYLSFLSLTDRNLVPVIIIYLLIFPTSSIHLVSELLT